MKINAAFKVGLRKAAIQPGRQYLVGVSGGVDSVVLAYLLNNCEISFSIAHLNHGARASAAREQEFVRQLAESLKVDFFTAAIDVPAKQNDENLSFEEAARIARYHFLMDTAERQACAGVIVGHQADDQVETVLMHLLRGSGIAGLAGMGYREINASFSSDIPILRPMLGIWREMINEYAGEEKLEYILDESNLDTDFFRNRLRHHLIPVLEDYNQQARLHLWQSSMIAQQTEDLLEGMADEVWQRIVLQESRELVLCDRSGFLKVNTELQHLLIRRMLCHLLPTTRDFGYDLTHSVREMIESPPESSQFQIIEPMYALIIEDTFMVGNIQAIINMLEQDFPQWTQESTPFMLDSGPFNLSNRLTIYASIHPIAEFEGKDWRSGSSMEAWLDADMLNLPLTLRSFQTGDRFEPLGMPDQHRKLSDYFIDQKIPQIIRDNYPLLCDQTGIVWVIGQRISDSFKITEKTKRVIHLELCKLK